MLSRTKYSSLLSLRRGAAGLDVCHQNLWTTPTSSTTTKALNIHETLQSIINSRRSRSSNNNSDVAPQRLITTCSSCKFVRSTSTTANRINNRVCNDITEVQVHESKYHQKRRSSSSSRSSNSSSSNNNSSNHRDKPDCYSQDLATTQPDSTRYWFGLRPENQGPRLRSQNQDKLNGAQKRIWMVVLDLEPPRKL